MPIHLKKAYECAETYTHHLGKRVRGAGFIKTLLLRRMGSSIAAGRQTVERLLARDDQALHAWGLKSMSIPHRYTTVTLPHTRGV